MSAPRLISPLLDGFLLGDAFARQDGVQCCPAIDQMTGDKYIVKIISIPTSPTQMDALLMTGAFSDKNSANAYYKELARELLKEAKALRQLAAVGGFVDFDAIQIVPGPENTGFEIYLLSPYRNSLQQMLADHSWTHLEILNLALDLCAALWAARKSGYMYVDLKPSNIFVDSKGYRIGDLGFLPFPAPATLRLPDHFRSPYTPPELQADPAALNQTTDIYALGLLLYQVYNGGKLPNQNDLVGALYAPPLYADYEMAQIILRACAPDPAIRYQEPSEIVNALTRYSKRNGIHDVPVIPAALSGVAASCLDTDPPGRHTEAEPGEHALFTGFTLDETAPSEESADNVSPSAVTEETSAMLHQADSLIAHKPPAPAVAPAPKKLPIPPPPAPQPEPEPVAAAEEKVEPPPARPPRARPADRPRRPRTKKKINISRQSFIRILIILLAAILLLEVGIGVFLHYRSTHRHTVHDVAITGDAQSIRVQISADTSDDILRVICIDSYGTVHQSTVSDGIAHFTGLFPRMMYTIRLEAAKGHTLIGTLSHRFTTDPQTSILSFYAGAGLEPGSVIVNLAADGASDGPWILRYSATGIGEQTAVFTGQSTILYNLAAGTTYTFTLSSQDGHPIVGQTQITFTVPVPPVAP